MSHSSPLLSVRNLTKKYGSLTAVDHVNLEITPGEIFAMLGPNGAGKTTLISCVCGLIQHFSGNIQVAGYDVIKHYRLTRQVVGVVPQELNFDAFSNVRQALIYQGGMFGHRRAARRADELLSVFGLTEKAGANTRWLSGGMKRRLMICKALMHRPALLFLDEPTAGVDVELREELWNYVRELRKEGMTIVLTTHYLEEAEQLADRIGIINQGRLILVEERERLLTKFGSRWLQLKCKEPIPDSLIGKLEEFSPERCDETALELHYRETDSIEKNSSNPPVERILAAVHAENLTLLSLEGNHSSLEKIFRDILEHDNTRGMHHAASRVENESDYARH